MRRAVIERRTAETEIALTLDLDGRGRSEIATGVGFIGTVGFVGLVAPHCARILVGEDQRYLMPVSTLFGMLVMLTASTVSKLMTQGSMLPVGIVTSIVGVPFLFVLLMREVR